MVITGIFILINVKFKQGEMTARIQSGMADIIIDPQTSAYLSIYDNYEDTNGVYLDLKTQSALSLFQENKIRLYVKEKGNWNQLKWDQVRINSNQNIFYIGPDDNKFDEKSGRMIELKYEANLRDKNYDLITLQPHRIFCGMEFMQFIPRIVLGFALILVAFIGECFWFIIILFKKWKATKKGEA